VGSPVGVAVGLGHALGHLAVAGDELAVDAAEHLLSSLSLSLSNSLFPHLSLWARQAIAGDELAVDAAEHLHQKYRTMYINT
jgi:hypothetical protein